MTEYLSRPTGFIWLPKLIPVLWVAACAWPFGGATWSSQFWINLGGIASLIFAIGAIYLSRQPQKLSRSAFLLLVTGCLVGIFALIQCVPLSGKSFPLSALPMIQTELNYLEPEVPNETPLPIATNAAPTVSDQKLSISVDRGHTLAAVSNIGLAMIAFGLGYFLIGTSPQLAFGALLIIATNCAVISAIGICEDISSAKWQLLDIEKPTAFASYVSRNSAAIFLNIGIAAGLGAIGFKEDKSNRISSDPGYRYTSPSIVSKITHFLEDVAAEVSSAKLALAAAMVLMFVGVLVTLSRGGMISSVAAFMAIAAVAVIRIRRFEGALLTGTILLAAAALVVWLEQLDPISNRIETVTEGDAVTTDLRWVVWRFAQKAFSVMWLTGGGLGNFHYSYLPFQDQAVDIWFYHAESFYWQSAVDLGILGGFAIALIIFLIIRTIDKLLKQTENRTSLAIATATIFLLTSTALHSFVDFSLFLPGIYLPFCLILGIAFANSELQIAKRRRKSKRRSRLERARDNNQTNEGTNNYSYILPLAIAVGLVAIGTYFNQPRTAADQLQAELNDWSFEQEQAETKLEGIIARGERELAKFPNDGHLNIVMGRAYTGRFRWLQYRLAPTGKAAWDATTPIFSRDSYFRRSKTENLNIQTLLSDPEQSEALTKAYACWHKAHQMLPLDWRPHLALAELDFVQFDQERTAFHLNALQSLAFNRAKLLTNAGIIALIYPGKESAFPLFKRAMESKPTELNSIFNIALMQYGQDIVNQPFLPQHAPSLLQLVKRYETPTADPVIVEGLWKSISQAIPNLPDSDRQKALIAAEVARRQGDLKGEVDQLRLAVVANPLNAEIRFSYAQALFRAKQYVQAREQINTCLRQQPDKQEFVKFKEQLQQSLPSLPSTGN